MSNGAKKFIGWSIVILVVITILVVKGQLSQTDAHNGVATASDTFFGLIGAAFSGLWHLLTG